MIRCLRFVKNALRRPDGSEDPKTVFLAGGRGARDAQLKERNVRSGQKMPDAGKLVVATLDTKPDGKVQALDATVGYEIDLIAEGEALLDAFRSDEWERVQGRLLATHGDDAVKRAVRALLPERDVAVRLCALPEATKEDVRLALGLLDPTVSLSNQREWTIVEKALRSLGLVREMRDELLAHPIEFFRALALKDIEGMAWEEARSAGAARLEELFGRLAPKAKGFGEYTAFVRKFLALDNLAMLDFALGKLDHADLDVSKPALLYIWERGCEEDARKAVRRRSVFRSPQVCASFPPRLMLEAMGPSKMPTDALFAAARDVAPERRAPVFEECMRPVEASLNQSLGPIGS